MDQSQHKSILIGSLAGLGIAALVGLFSWMDWASGLVNFLAALPTFIAWRLAVPSFFEPLALCVYWMVVGSVVGWLARGGAGTHLAIIAALVLILLLAHRRAQVSWESSVRTVNDILIVGE